ncbi:MAG: hypothetical protein ABSE73_27890 [Planctomycetota bacterium]
MREDQLRKVQGTAGAVDQNQRRPKKHPARKQVSGNPALYIGAGVALLLALVAVIMSSGKSDEQATNTRKTEEKKGAQEKRTPQAEQQPKIETPKDETSAALAAQAERERAFSAEAASRPKTSAL